MGRSQPWKAELSALILVCFCGVAGAETFNYDLSAGIGGGGTTLDGTFTINGNAGDAFGLDSSFTGISAFNIEWNSGVGPIVDWNFGDLGLAEIAGVDFSGVMGDPVLTPVGDFSDGFFLGTLAYGEPFIVELGFDGTDPAWAVGIFGVGALDTGTGWDLATARLPSGFFMGLAGLAAVIAWRRNGLLVRERCEA
jgi:hypothetical protein